MSDLCQHSVDRMISSYYEPLRGQCCQFCWRPNSFLTCHPLLSLDNLTYPYDVLLSLHWWLPNEGLQPILLSIILIQPTCLLSTSTNSSNSSYPTWNQHLWKCDPSPPVFLTSINDTTIHPLVQHKNLRVILNSSLPLTSHNKPIIKRYQLYLHNISKSAIFIHLHCYCLYPNNYQLFPELLQYLPNWSLYIYFYSHNTFSRTRIIFSKQI